MEIDREFQQLEEQKLKKIRIFKTLNVIMSILLPIFIFWLAVIISSVNTLIPVAYPERKFVIMFLQIYSLVLIIILFHFRIKKPKEDEKLDSGYSRMGWLIIKHSHHKEELINHEVKVGNKFICAGCYGGILGLSVGEIFGLIYVSNFDRGTIYLGLISVHIGIILTSISFLKYIISVYGFKRLLINACLPLGLWIILIGADIYFRNFISVVYNFFIILFLGFERLYLTFLDHKPQESSKKNHKSTKQI